MLFLPPLITDILCLFELSLKLVRQLLYTLLNLSTFLIQLLLTVIYRYIYLWVLQNNRQDKKLLATNRVKYGPFRKSKETII